MLRVHMLGLYIIMLTSVCMDQVFNYSLELKNNTHHLTPTTITELEVLVFGR